VSPWEKNQGVVQQAGSSNPVNTQQESISAIRWRNNGTLPNTPSGKY
jgi:hypothetical protein